MKGTAAMKLKMQKNMRIVSAMMGYCYHLGGTHFQVDLAMEAECTRILVSTEVDGLGGEETARVAKVLNTPRQRDMEQTYWNLSGDEEEGDELLLVGVMVDSATVDYDGSRLVIRLERLHHSTEE